MLITKDIARLFNLKNPLYFFTTSFLDIFYIFNIRMKKVKITFMTTSTCVKRVCFEMDLLIYSLVISVLSAFAPIFVKFIVSRIYRISDQEIQLQQETMQLKRQMNEISMVDEFAKYAKLQRKLNKVNDELKKLANERLTSLMKLKLSFTYSMHIIFSLVLLCIVWFNRAVPVIVFPEERLWPLAEILSWPTGVPGGVSIAIWIFVTNKVARKIAACLT